MRGFTKRRPCFLTAMEGCVTNLKYQQTLAAFDRGCCAAPALAKRATGPVGSAGGAGQDVFVL